MKVLFAASTFPRWHADRLPDFVWQQIVRIREVRPDVQPFVLAPHDVGAMREETWDGIRIRRFRYLYPAAAQKLVYPAIWPNIQQAPWLLFQVPLLLVFEFVAALRWIRRERFALVYSHWFMPQGVACGLAALMTGTPHVFTSHSSDVAVMRRVPLLGPWLVRLLSRRARAITVVSERSRAALERFFTQAEWRLLEKKVAVVPMGVTLPARQPALPLVSADPVDRDRPATRARLLFLGRLVEKKGVSYLLRALTLEPLRSIDVSATIAGDGPLLGALRAEAAQLGLGDRIAFRGHVRGAAKDALIREANVVVLPSIVTRGGDAEGLPVVLLEALAMGKICVATDVSGADEVLRAGLDGLIVPQQDARALARAIAKAVSMPELARRRMSEEAHGTAQRFDWPTIAREHARHLFPPA